MRRETVEVKSGKQRCEIACGVTSLTSEAESPQRLLAVAETMRNLAGNPRRGLDFLKMTDKVVPKPATDRSQGPYLSPHHQHLALRDARSCPN